MTTPAKAGPPILGIIFLLLGLFKFINGGSWVVWIILGCLFGGLGIFTSRKSRGAQ
ncbi:MAG: hypothetical protein J7496_14965 [Novosphingobium sp.]|nr:hypothetical protein [Novosphingobium sp.]MBO9603801.1 hypothetical protein [Novosphingobium sp.]